MDTTACIFLFFQTNTSQYCTLYAVCRYGDREKQKLPENCPKYCEQKVFLYPKHLKMVGRYNSLFGYDEKILWDEKQLQDYLEQGLTDCCECFFVIVGHCLDRNAFYIENDSAEMQQGRKNTMESVLDRVIKQNTENVNLLKTKRLQYFFCFTDTVKASSDLPHDS